MSGQDSAHDSPQVSAKVLIDPNHPEAGRGGVVPPEHSRFQPGNRANPGGRPKGALPRTAWLRAISKNADEDGIGQGSIEIAERVVALTRKLTEDGADVDRLSTELKALLALFSEAEGKPTEHVISEQTGDRTVILREPASKTPELPK